MKFDRESKEWIKQFEVMKQVLWIISELFPPEETSTGYIMGEIAIAMTCKYDVKVICGPTVYDFSKKQDANSKTVVDERIKVLRVEAVSENKSSKLSRVKKFLLMSWRMYCVAKKHVMKGDRVLMVTNPFPLVVLMGHLRRRREFELALLVHDVAPENLYIDISIPRIVYPIVKHMFDKAYASSNLLISLGRDMSEIMVKKIRSVKNSYHLIGLETRSPRIEVIENWGDVENIRPTNNFKSERITIQYAGNIGNAQGVEEMVDVLHEAKCEQVAFDIWGTGSAEASIRKKVEGYGMSEQVSFHGPYFRSEQQAVLNACDIALVCLVKGMYGLAVPSKIYNILAAGKPVLYIGERDTEIWRLIEENGNGVCFEPQDRAGLMEYLHGLTLESRRKLGEMGKISRKLAEKKYSKQVILNKYVEIL